MKLYYFFQFHSHSTFKFVRFVPYYFNKLEKNKILISYFPAHFPWHNQTLESVFQLISHYTTKHRKILSRNSLSPEFTFQKETTFQQTNGAIVYVLSFLRITIWCMDLCFQLIMRTTIFYSLFSQIP